MGPWWEQVAGKVGEDFSDLHDVAAMVRVALRLLLAACLGGVVGYQRGQVGKSAGLRTHMLVALGAGMFALVPQLMGASSADITRVIQGLAAGIGFLGAGAILKGSNESQVKGLTTAAGIWLTAGIGMAAGLGREMTAIFCTILAILILVVVPHPDDTQKDTSRSPPQQDGQDDPQHRLRV